MSHALTPQQQSGLSQYLELVEQSPEYWQTFSAKALCTRQGEKLLREALKPSCNDVPYPNERFLYTDIIGALAADMGVNANRRCLEAETRDIKSCAVEGLDSLRIAVYGDVVQTPDGPMQGIPEGAYVGSIAAYPDQQRLRALFDNATWEPDAADPSSWVNSLLVQDGVCIVVPDGVKISKPIEIINLTKFIIPILSNRRILVYLGRGAEADIIVTDNAKDKTLQTSTCDASLHLSEGSRLAYYTVENTNEQTVSLSNIRVMQRSGSRFAFNSTTLRCRQTRTTLTIDQPDHDAVAEVCGAVVADQQEKTDNYVRVVHGGEGNRSNMLFKYVLGGKAIGAFTGEVYVAPGARRIVSEQQSQNLLTSDDARTYSRPVLEIYADDVKCSHGATVGKLDETALFYMQQRGIAEPEARLLLQHAFVNDVLQRIEIPALRERLSTLVERRIKSGRAQCDGCRMAEVCKDN